MAWRAGTTCCRVPMQNRFTRISSTRHGRPSTSRRQRPTARTRGNKTWPHLTLAGDTMRLHPTGRFDNHAATHRHIEARPLAAAMGAEICGVDAASITPDQFDELRQALFRHKMIYLRRQQLTHAEQETFSLRFGPFAEDAYTQGVP